MTENTITINGTTATRDEWLAKRRNSIGASEAAIVLGLVGSRIKLYLDKKGLLPPEDPTPEMTRGLKLEPYIAEMWAEKTGDPIVQTQVFLRHYAMPWLSATVDGITASGRLVEFKRCGPHGLVRHVEGPDDLECLPDPWVIQCQQQMIVHDCEAVWFAIKTPDDDVHPVGPVRINEALCRVIVRDVGAFWHDFVIPGIPPDEVVAEDARTLTRAFRGQSGEWLVLGEESGADAALMRDLSGQIRELERSRDEAKARLLLALGDAEGADLPGGWTVRRTVSETKAHEVKASTRVVLRVLEPKES